MPDGNMQLEERGFTRLTQADFFEFREQASGDLRWRLDMVRGEISPGDDAWVYRRAGVIRGLGALSEFTPWHWVLWSFPGVLNLGDWKTIIRFTRLRLARKIAEPQVLRISAQTQYGHTRASALLEHLGFRVEGLMRCYDPSGADCWLYAIARAPAESGGL